MRSSKWMCRRGWPPVGVGACTVLLLAAMGCRAVPSDAPSTLTEAAVRGDVGAVRAFLANGTPAGSTDDRGETALHLAAAHGHTATVRVLLQAGADVHARNADGATALHEAAGMGDVEACRLLIDAGADVRVVSDSGNTPLHRAAELRNMEQAQIIEALGFRHNFEFKTDNLEVARLLISKGADVDAQNRLGQTPLQRTTPWNNLPVARSLVEAGARVDIRDAEGLTALDHARRKGAHDIVALLQ